MAEVAPESYFFFKKKNPPLLLPLLFRRLQNRTNGWSRKTWSELARVSVWAEAVQCFQKSKTRSWLWSIPVCPSWRIVKTDEFLSLLKEIRISFWKLLRGGGSPAATIPRKRSIPQNWLIKYLTKTITPKHHLLTLRGKYTNRCVCETGWHCWKKKMPLCQLPRQTIVHVVWYIHIYERVCQRRAPISEYLTLNWRCQHHLSKKENGC